MTVVSIRQRQDLRSLAVFRFLLGLYVVYDVLSRLKHGNLSIAWYTSSTGSFLHPHDSPHGSPLHKFWFYRGDHFIQAALFFFTGIVALAFAIGLKCNSPLKVSLWLLVVAMQHRNMHLHDGSDTYIRHLLLWCCHLPVAQVWSLDSILQSKHGKVRGQQVLHPNGSAVWGLRLQIIFMYLGTVLNRTTDLYGWSVGRSTWMPPRLTAVHYSLNASFAIRDCWLGDFVRSRFLLTQIMTLSAMAIEGVAPIACLLLNEHAHIPACMLFMLHLGLLVLINLPNWQFAGMLASIVWVPSSVWDSLQRRLSQRFPQTISSPHDENRIEWALKKDDDALITPANESVWLLRRKRPYMTYFFLTYMIYNFCGERRWITKHDGGDIGEFLRFSQYWVMFGTISTTTVKTMLVGKMDGQDVDVWEWIRNGHVKTINMEARQSQIWSNMTHVFPSPRWERIFYQWGERRDTNRGHYFLTQLCIVASPFEALTLIWQHLVVMPPNSITRYQQSSFPNTVVHVDCGKTSRKRNIV